MVEYLYREEKKINFVQIAKRENDHYSYWNNRIKEWRENDMTAYGIFMGFEDGLHFPISEEEVQKIVSKYQKSDRVGS